MIDKYYNFDEINGDDYDDDGEEDDDDDEYSDNDVYNMLFN